MKICEACSIDIRNRTPGSKCSAGTSHKWKVMSGATKTKVSVALAVAEAPSTSAPKLTADELRSKYARKKWPEDDPYNRHIYNSCEWGSHPFAVRLPTGQEVCGECHKVIN